MKDEELAEEYAKGLCKTCTVDTCRYNTLQTCAIKEYIKQAYLAGLKDSRPQWHNLRENPNDLPEDTYDVLDQAGYKVHYNFSQNVWLNEKDEIDEHVIAWCEVPIFNEEKNIKSKKCKNCEGTGFVPLGEGIKGIKKCPFCDGTGKIETEKENG